MMRIQKYFTRIFQFVKDFMYWTPSRIKIIQIKVLQQFWKYKSLYLIIKNVLVCFDINWNRVIDKRFLRMISRTLVFIIYLHVSMNNYKLYCAQDQTTSIPTTYIKYKDARKTVFLLAKTNYKHYKSRILYWL